jgi:hypothetical protein
MVRSMSRLGRTVLISVAALFLSIGQAGATVYNLSFVSAGWYSDLGDHDPSNRSHLTGEIFIPGPRGEAFFRSFYTFTLPVITGTIVSVEFDAFNPDFGFSSGDPNETLGIFDVTTPAGSLNTLHAQGDPLGMAVFADLGTGAQYGSRVVSNADNNNTVTVTLNASAFAALTAAGPGLFALGGALTTLNPSPSTEFVFAGTEGALGPDVRNIHLIITTQANSVPEPATLALLGAAMAGMGWSRRRRI